MAFLLVDTRPAPRIILSVILDGKGLKAVDLKKIGEAVEEGGIIAFPTDTVYGLGCDAFNASAVARIYALKKRKETKPLALFVSHKDLVREYARPNTTAERLIDKFFPGPLTVIMEQSNSSPSGLVGSNDRIGVRIPDNGVISRVLNTLSTPLATTSANLSGKGEATTAEMVLSRFADEKIEIIIDGGLCNHLPSAVIDTTNSPPVLLRNGRVSIPEMEKTVGCDIRLADGVNLLVLFVCTGNSCRSPMASGLLKKRLTETARRRVRIISAGTSVSSDSPPTNLAGRAAEEQGVDISLHRSRVISRDILEKADLIIGFEPQHLQRISQLLPDALSKSFLLGAFGTDISSVDVLIEDPVGRGWEAYKSCMDEIKNSMNRLVNYLESKFK